MLISRLSHQEVEGKRWCYYRTQGSLTDNSGRSDHLQPCYWRPEAAFSHRKSITSIPNMAAEQETSCIFLRTPGDTSAVFCWWWWWRWILMDSDCRGLFSIWHHDITERRVWLMTSSVEDKEQPPADARYVDTAWRQLIGCTESAQRRTQQFCETLQCWVDFNQTD